MFLVIIGIAWWLSAILEAGGSLNDVCSAIDDVLWVLNTAGEMFGLKRAGDDVTLGEAQPPAKRSRTE